MSEKKQQSNKGVDKSREALLSGARKREKPAHAFMSNSDSDNHNTKTENHKGNNSDNHKSEQEHEDVIEEKNKETEQYSGSDKSYTEQQKRNKTNNITSNNESETTNEDEDFWDLIEQEKKKKTVEQTHTRQTYLIRNDLLKELNKVSRKQGKGFKTKVINYALEQFLNDINNVHRK